MSHHRADVPALLAMVVAVLLAVLILGSEQEVEALDRPTHPARDAEGVATANMLRDARIALERQATAHHVAPSPHLRTRIERNLPHTVVRECPARRVYIQYRHPCLLEKSSFDPQSAGQRQWTTRAMLESDLRMARMGVVLHGDLTTLLTCKLSEYAIRLTVI